MLDLEYKKRDIFNEVLRVSEGKTNKEITKILIEKLENAMKIASDLEDKELYNLGEEEFINRIEAFYGNFPIEKYIIIPSKCNINVVKIKYTLIKKYLSKEKLKKDLIEYIIDIKKQVKEFIDFYNEVESILEENTSFLNKTINNGK